MQVGRCSLSAEISQHHVVVATAFSDSLGYSNTKLPFTQDHKKAEVVLRNPCEDLSLDSTSERRGRPHGWIVSRLCIN